MRALALSLIGILIWTCALAQAGGGAQTDSGGKITASAVWRPPQDFVTKAHEICDKGAGPASFSQCFMNQISAAGTPAAAMAFTRMLYKQSDGQLGIMSAFKNYGLVDAAQVFYPLRANDNYVLLLVNGDPAIIDVDDLQKLERPAMESDPAFQSIKQKYPKADIWPGDRSGNNPWPRMQSLPGGGTQFVVNYPLIDGCHACQHVGLARFGWDFDPSGKFLRTTYMVSPPRLGTGSNCSRPRNRLSHSASDPTSFSSGAARVRSAKLVTIQARGMHAQGIRVVGCDGAGHARICAIGAGVDQRVGSVAAGKRLPGEGTRGVRPGVTVSEIRRVCHQPNAKSRSFR